MKAEEALTALLVTNGVNGVNSSGTGGGGGGGGGGVFFLLGKSRYKFWALAAVLLLGFWSMFTGTVTLKWSAGNLNPLSDNFDSPIHTDLDVLELEEREKLVRQMWDVYTQSKTTRLPSFWLEAFEAAYEELTSDVPGVRNAAVSEIARMSLRSISFEPLTVLSTSTRETSTITSKKGEKGKKMM